MDSLPTYIMSAMLLLQGTVDAYDKRRRAFLWSGEDHVSGAQCLVAWNSVMLPKSHGGLGVRNLSVQNQCLLLKLLHRLHHPGDSAWAKWARTDLCLATLDGPLEGAHWDALRALLPAYQCLTSVVVRDGRATDFWKDTWLPCGALADCFLVLFSHALPQAISVRQVMQASIRDCLQARLTAQATAELSSLTDALASVSLSDLPDIRSSPFENDAHKLITSNLYRLLICQGPEEAYHKFVWCNKAPPKVQFFSWLLVRDRIHCKSNLKHKHILDNDTCETCTQSPETAKHLIMECPFSCSFWTALGVDTSTMPLMHELWKMPRPPNIPTKHHDVFIQLCCWNLWKHRHDVVFRSLPPSLERLRQSCYADAQLWKYRLPHDDLHVAHAWCNLFSSMDV